MPVFLSKANQSSLKCNCS